MKAMARRTSIPKPLALVIGLLLVIGGGGLLTASAINGNEAFSALQRGDPLYTERSLSQNTVTLAVHVQAIEEEGADPEPVEGAWVLVGQHPTSREETRFSFRAQPTDADGRALFELRPDRYLVLVRTAEEVPFEEGRHRISLMSAIENGHAISLNEDTRLGVLIDEEGEVHYNTQSRGEMREHGARHPLFIRVGQLEENRTRSPVESATIIVYTYLGEDERGDAVARNQTDARGGAGFYLHTGRYIVNVETPDGDQTWFRVGLKQSTSALVMFHPDGSARTSVHGDKDTTTDTRPDERPSRERPTTQDSTRPTTATAQETRPLAFWLRWISS